MTRKNTVSKSLAVIGVIATLGALLGWGWTATGWTILPAINNARVAIEEAKHPLFTAHYGLPLGSQKTYSVNLTFGCSPGFYDATCSVTKPVSNSSTTIEDYVTFDLSLPNGTAILIWYSGPKGNMTFDCGGGSGSAYSSCILEPDAPGANSGPRNFYFLVPTPGNYSVHILSQQCMSSPNWTTNTAIGTVTTGLSTIQYNRPYWAWGLATEIGATIGVISTMIVAGISAYRDQKQRVTLPSPSRGRSPERVVD